MKSKEIKTRIVLHSRGITTLEVFVLGQVKRGLFYTSVVSIPVSYGRNVAEATALVKERLKEYMAVGFDDKGMINL